MTLGLSGDFRHMPSYPAVTPLILSSMILMIRTLACFECLLCAGYHAKIFTNVTEFSPPC